jgi:hypothetical protein
MANEKTCGTCRSWHKLVRPAGQPANIVDGKIVIDGQCRRFPPSATSLPMPGGTLIKCNYPPTEATWIACDEYKPKIEAPQGSLEI